MSNILELRDVCKDFGSFKLEGISFDLPQGFIMGLIGPNGAGKTTTIKLILNMLRRDSGTIKVFGEDNTQAERQIKERIGVVMDNPFYVNEWNLTDVERALSPFYASWDSGKYHQLIKAFDLDTKKKIKDLSRGMKMKMMIAVSLSHDADLLILDEPTSGLDAVARSELMDILLDHIKDGNKSVLFSTHITSDLEKIADYITFISRGRMIYSNTKDELLESYCVVKGGLNSLSSEQRRLIIGYHEHSVGFDGLAEKSILSRLPKSIVTESATLDEIVVKFNSHKQV